VGEQAGNLADIVKGNKRNQTSMEENRKNDREEELWVKRDEPGTQER